MKKQLIIFIGIFLLSGATYAQDVKTELFEKSVEYLQSGDYINGLEYTNMLLEKSPNNPYLLYNKGVALFQLCDLEGACESFLKSKEWGYEPENSSFIDYYCDSDVIFGHLKEHYYVGQELLEENGFRPAYTRKDTLRGMLRPERTCFDVHYYNLSVRINTREKSIVGNNEIYFKVVEPSKTIQLDLFDNLTIDSITHNNKRLSFTREYDAVWVEFNTELHKENSEQITVFYHGQPRIAPKPPWDGGFVWEKSGLFTQHNGVSCEQLGASVWWPNKDHLSDRPDSMGINLEVPKKYQAISNGTLRDIKDLGKGYHRYEWAVNYPINNYNATFYMGKFAEFTDTVHSLNDTLICRYHVLPKNLKVAKEHFKQARLVVDFYNRMYGPFPFWDDNFRMVESPYEGMEHQTAIAYGSAYSNSENAHTYLNKNYDYIIVHEAAHEWWGNAVSVADMADAWIHEGFATYSEYLFIEDQHGYADYISELQNRVRYIYNFWPMVENRDVNEDAFASSDIYTKGATMLHCFRATINNDSLFFDLVRGFYNKHKNNPANTDDFISFANNFLDDNYSDFFAKYLYDTKLPVLSYSYEKKDEGILFKYKWTDVGPEFKMAFGLEFSNGNAQRFLGTTEEQEFFIDNANTFYFLNENKDLSNAPHNSFTYYRTREGN